MIHLELPVLLGAVLAGLGVYGILARRNAVLVLIGVELLLNAANLLLVTAGSRPGTPFAAGAVLTLFVITIAAAEISIALAVILLMFRRHGHIDLTAVPLLEDDPDDPVDLGDDAADVAPDVSGSRYPGAIPALGSPRPDEEPRPAPDEDQPERSVVR
jgi:NADH-quinone oxidoreductase subunit K